MAEVLRFGLQALSGLAAAHSAGVVHRDIKPDNLLITPEGRLKITDFGLAKLTNTASTLTQEGQMMGTPAYLAPEQLLSLPVDHRADIFSLGATLYEAVAGRRAFGAEHEMAVLYSVLNEDPPAFVEIGLEAPEGLESVLRMALRKEAELRYQSAVDMLADIEQLLAAEEGRLTAPLALKASPVEARRGAAAHALPFVARRAELEALGQALRGSGTREA